MGLIKTRNKTYFEVWVEVRDATGTVVDRLATYRERKGDAMEEVKRFLKPYDDSHTVNGEIVPYERTFRVFP